MRRRYRSKKRDDSEKGDFFQALFVLTILGSFTLFCIDPALFLKALAGIVVLIILIVAGARRWDRHKARKFDATYDAVTKSYGSVLGNFVDQFGRAKPKDAAFTYQQYAFTEEHLGYLQDDLAKHGFALSVRLKTS